MSYVLIMALNLCKTLRNSTVNDYNKVQIMKTWS